MEVRTVGNENITLFFIYLRGKEMINTKPPKYNQEAVMNRDSVSKEFPEEKIFKINLA